MWDTKNIQIICAFFYFLFIFNRYLLEWAEYKKTDAYKVFRRQQIDQKDAAFAKKNKPNTSTEATTTSGGRYHKPWLSSLKIINCKIMDIAH